MCTPVKFLHTKLTNIQTNSLIHIFMDLALCADAQSCWNRKGSFPNCSHKVGSMKLSKLSWYANALRVLSLELRGQAQPLKNNPAPQPPSTKMYTWQCSQASTILLATIKPRLYCWGNFNLTCITYDYWALCFYILYYLFTPYMQ